MTMFLILMALYVVAGAVQLPALGRRAHTELSARNHHPTAPELEVIRAAGRQAAGQALVWPVSLVQHYAVAPLLADYQARQDAREAERIAAENRAAIRAHEEQEKAKFDAALEPPKPAIGRPAGVTELPAAGSRSGRAAGLSAVLTGD